MTEETRRSFVKRSSSGLAAALLGAIDAPSAEARTRPAGAGLEWRFYGGDPGGSRFSTLRQIHRGNVHVLERAWIYHTGEVDQTSRAFECTPLVIAGVLYLSTPSSRVIALEAETGKEIWRFDPQARSAVREYMQHRGVSYWERGRAKRILYGTFDGHLIALDAATGKPCASFGDGGVVDLRPGAADRWPKSHYSVTSPPAVYKDLVIVGCRLHETPSKGRAATYAPSTSEPGSSSGSSTPSPAAEFRRSSSGPSDPRRIVQATSCGAGFST